MQKVVQHTEILDFTRNNISTTMILFMLDFECILYGKTYKPKILCAYFYFFRICLDKELQEKIIVADIHSRAQTKKKIQRNGKCKKGLILLLFMLINARCLGDCTKTLEPFVDSGQKVAMFDVGMEYVNS